MASDPLKGELVSPEPKAALPAIPSIDWGKDRVILAGVNPRLTTGEKVKLYNGLVGRAKDIKELKAKEILLESVIILEHAWLKEDGEVNDGFKVFLIDNETNVWFCGSSGIATSIGMLRSFFGEPPWKPSLPVKLIETDLPQGKRYYTLELFSPERKPAAKKSGE